MEIIRHVLDHISDHIPDHIGRWETKSLNDLPSRQQLGLLIISLTVFYSLYFVLSSILSWYRLRQFHGPFSAAWSRFYLAKISVSGRSFKTLMDVHRKYGRLVRIGPNELMTNDANLIKMMGSAKSNWARSKWYNSGRVHPVDNTILNVTDTGEHDKLRHGLIPGYSGRDNWSLEGDIDGQLVRLIGLIRDKYLSTKEKTRPLEFVKMSQYFTVDTMTKICFGEPFGCLDIDGDRHDTLQTVQRIVMWGEITANVPLMQHLLSWAVIFNTLAYPLARELSKFNSLAKRIVAKRFSEVGDLTTTNVKSDKHGDMLEGFMNRGFSQRLCELQVPVQLTAGTETTATAIRSTLLHIITAPEVYRKLKDEIDDAIANGKISSPIKFSEAKELPYVVAVVYEGLRIHPPFSGLLMKLVPPEGYTHSDGRFIPGGTFIGQNTWDAVRDPEIFGDDAHMFRPDRFIEADAATRGRMRSTVDLVFGYGRWQCMGRPISMMEMHKVFVELLRNFDIQIMNPFNPITTFNVNLFLQDDMYIRVTERHQDEHGVSQVAEEA